MYQELYQEYQEKRFSKKGISLDIDIFIKPHLKITGLEDDRCT